MGEALFDVPNLDDLSVESEDYLKAERVFKLLAQYAEHKRGSMESRKCGSIQQAIAYEKLMEMTYNELPMWARW